MNEKLIIISAPSGAGKTTIVNHLLRKDLDLEFSVSATTRKPRGRETNGKEYYFISVNDFKSRIKNGEFAEWEEVYEEQFYGTLKSEIERIWSHSRHVVFDVDAKGGISLKNIYGHRALSIFIMPPSVGVLEKRLVRRATDCRENISIRIEKALKEMKFADQFDHIIINDNLERAEGEVYNLVHNFLNK
jgi:guanylate kinase